MNLKYAYAAVALIALGCTTAPRDGTVTVNSRQTTITAPGTVTFDVRNSAGQTAHLLRCGPHIRANLERLQSGGWVALPTDTCGNAVAFPLHLPSGRRASDNVWFAEPGVYRLQVSYGMGPETVRYFAYSPQITVQ